MVGTDAHSPIQLLALEHQGLKALFDRDEVLVKLFLQNKKQTRSTNTGVDDTSKEVQVESSCFLFSHDIIYLYRFENSR